MLSSGNVVFHSVFVCFIGATHVPGRVSQDIAPTDTILKVINEIFTCLKLKENGNSNNKELLIKLVGFSQYKSDNWKEILRLTNINIKTYNSSTDYMKTVINEIMKQKIKIGEGIDIRNVDDVNKESKTFLRKFKEFYLRKIPYRTLNNKTSKLLPKGPTNHSTYSKNTVPDEVNLGENGTEDIEVWMPSDSRRVFQGQQTKISKYPFVASIHIFTEFSCAGSIIAADLVITAASCLQLAYNNRFYRENAKFLTVRVGSSFYSVDGDLIPVLEVYFHPLYDPPTLHNNLAIMRLHRHIRFRNRSRVKKVDIDTNANALPRNTDGIAIVGWGAKTTANKIKGPSMKIALSILQFYPLDECQELYTKTFVTERHFCAGFFSQGGGACNRDVGAPGLAGGRLVGVVSFASSSCGAADAPTVFTKLGYYTDWIEAVMAQKTRQYINRPTATDRPHPVHSIMTMTPKSEVIRPQDLERPSIPSATKNHNFILRDRTFTTKSHVANQLRKPVHSIGLAGLPRDEEYTEATTETELDLEQFLQPDTDDSDVVNKLLNQIKAELDMKYTEPDKVREKDKINVGINKLFTESQLMENEHVDLTFFNKAKKEYSKYYNSVAENSPEPVQFDAYEVMAMPQIVLPKDQSSAGKRTERTPFENVADSPKINQQNLVNEQPEAIFSDFGLNQKINELIDYMDTIDKNSLEQEYFSSVDNVIGDNNLPEDLKIQQIDDDKLEPTEDLETWKN